MWEWAQIDLNISEQLFSTELLKKKNQCMAYMLNPGYDFPVARFPIHSGVVAGMDDSNYGKRLHRFQPFLINSGELL